MPTIEYHGIEFDFCEDGELNDLDVIDAAEFMAHHGDDFGECRFDEGYSHEAICDWARDTLSAAAWKLTGARGVPLHEQYGVRQYGPPC